MGRFGSGLLAADVEFSFLATSTGRMEFSARVLLSFKFGYSGSREFRQSAACSFAGFGRALGGMTLHVLVTRALISQAMGSFLLPQERGAAWQLRRARFGHRWQTLMIEPENANRLGNLRMQLHRSTISFFACDTAALAPSSAARNRNGISIAFANDIEIPE